MRRRKLKLAVCLLERLTDFVLFEPRLQSPGLISAGLQCVWTGAWAIITVKHRARKRRRSVGASSHFDGKGLGVGANTAVFSVVYGLDWIASVPPTAGLATDLFGTRSGPILFGWIFFGHQVGAALAAYGGGLLRVWFGT